MIALELPSFDPVAFWIPIPFVTWLPVRWYALAYIGGIVLGLLYASRLVRMPALWKGAAHGGKAPATPDDLSDLMVWATVGIILGGRLGYVLFYGVLYCGFAGSEAACAGMPGVFLENPLRIFAIWEGGMAFHGGLIGVVLAVIFFCRARGLDMVKVGDVVAAATPIGLFLGRLANFINGELWGRVSDVSWAMVFPTGGPLPRHPSQLYQAALEGVALFALMWVLLRFFRALDRPGLLIAVFLAGYGVARVIGEVFRDNPALIFEGGIVSMGMLLSLPMWAGAAFFFWYALMRPAPARP